MYITVLITLLTTLLSGAVSRDPDENRGVPALIESRGFVCETHYITTRDNYVLEVHRIVNPMIKTPGRPVILQHGLLSSGETANA